VESKLPTEQFPVLVRLNGIVHCFTQRVAGIDVRHDKQEVLRRLDGVHRNLREQHGLGAAPFITANQVHGREIAVIAEPVAADRCFSGFDGLITDQPNLCLGIYVADCCAVYLVDPVRHVIGLVHSGKKGTELGIVAHAIDTMSARFGSDPGELIVQLSPCIRPPHYEVDFASAIMRSARDRGVTKVYDVGTCTACDLDRYYSYRAEKAKTGRMLALLAIKASVES
jgi:copper oxidase (laccase) domain-containing protein